MKSSETLIDRTYTSANAQNAWAWQGDRVYLLGPSPDERLAYADTNGTVYYPHADRQGSTIALAAAGQDVLTRTYGPYGELSPAGDVAMAPGASAYPYLYTGQRFDPSLQAYDYKARIYDGKDGRFWQTDPIGNKDDLNLYEYAKDDPLDGTDPSGTCTGSMLPGKGCWMNGVTIGGDRPRAPPEEKKNSQRSGDNNHDGSLDLAEANEWYRIGNGAPVTVDASQLQVTIDDKMPSKGGNYGATVSGSGWWVHGGVSVRKDSSGRWVIVSSSYNFRQHQLHQGLYGGAKTMLRNIETGVGGCLATFCGAAKGTPFMIDYVGHPQIVPHYEAPIAVPQG